MARYKADQGTYGRTTAFVLLGAMWAFGAYTLYYFLLSFRGTDEAPSICCVGSSTGRRSRTS